MLERLIAEFIFRVRMELRSLEAMAEDAPVLERADLREIITEIIDTVTDEDNVTPITEARPHMTFGFGPTGR